KQFVDFAAAFAAEGNDGHFAFVGSFYGPQHVGRVPAGGNSHQYVARLPQRGDLSFEQGVEAVVVAHRRENGGVGIEGDARQRQTVALEPAHEFGDEMLGVRRRAAVAAGENFVVVGQGAEQEVDRVGKRLSQGLRTGLEGIDRIIEVRRHARDHVHERYYLMAAKAYSGASNTPFSQVSPAPSMAMTSKRQGGVRPAK